MHFSCSSRTRKRAFVNGRSFFRRRGILPQSAVISRLSYIYISALRKRHKIIKNPVRHVALGAAGQFPCGEGFGCVDRKLFLGGALELERGPITEVESGLRALDKAEDALVGEGGRGAGEEDSNEASRDHWR